MRWCVCTHTAGVRCVGWIRSQKRRDHFDVLGVGVAGVGIRTVEDIVVCVRHLAHRRIVCVCVCVCVCV